MTNLKNDLENIESIRVEIEKGVRFSGTNLWILIAAIFIASLGLNLNSTAVIIGAMLISPLMGPIIGLGIGASINDIELLKKAGANFLLSTVISLITSAIYFFFTPLNEAYSELLSRTRPNVYDVLIAVFGGFAAIIAISSKNKGNVLPGAAIATALMPPLCTAGYGIATGQLNFIAGALYLFIINSVFIALSSYAFARIMQFPVVRLKNERNQKRSSRIIIVITLITFLPSLYFGYEMVQKNRFESNANFFIQKEISEKGIFVLRKNIDSDDKKIEIFLVGNPIDSLFESNLVKLTSNYNIEKADLVLKQGVFNQTELKKAGQQTQLLERENYELIKRADSIVLRENRKSDITSEIKTLFPDVDEVYFTVDNTNNYKIIISTKKTNRLNYIDTASLNKWIINKIMNDSVLIKYL